MKKLLALSLAVATLLAGAAQAQQQCANGSSDFSCSGPLTWSQQAAPTSGTSVAGTWSPSTAQNCTTTSVVPISGCSCIGNSQTGQQTVLIMNSCGGATTSTQLCSTGGMCGN